MLDIFKSPAFGVIPLTDAINNVKFVPGRIGKMGLFSSTSVSTTAVAIEQRNGILVLVAPTPRGGPGITIDKSKRNLRMLPVPHFEINDAIMAEEVQGVRAWGQETAVEMVMDKIAERDVIHTQSMEATTEYSRIGAVKGIVTYADGTSMNLFDAFSVSAPAEIDFDLDNANPAAGIVRKRSAALIRQVATSLDGVPYSGLHAFCGDAFFDDLISHAEIRATYLQTQEAAELRTGYVDGGAGGSYGSFNFGGITWENYRGAVGNQPYIDPSKAHVFPVGVPGLFRTVYAPADYIETVNTMGKRWYQKQWAMPNDKGINLDTQMNEINYCTRPGALVTLRRT